MVHCSIAPRGNARIVRSRVAPHLRAPVSLRALHRPRIHRQPAMNDAAPAYDSHPLSLGIAGFTYADLYEPRALARLAAAFDDHLVAADAAVAGRFHGYRDCRGEGMSPESVSEILVETAPHLGRFIARLFRVEDAWREQQARIRDEDEVVFGLRNDFIAPLAKALKGEDPAAYDREGLAIEAAVLRAAAREGARLPDDDEYLSARAAALLSGRAALPPKFLARLRDAHDAWSTLDDETLVATARGALERWCHLVKRDPDFDAVAAHTWVSFKEPARTDVRRLVHHPQREHAGYTTWAADDTHRRRRDGFSLTDPRHPPAPRALRGRPLHLLSRPRQRHLLEGHAEQEGGRLQDQCTGRARHRLPAGREDFGDARGQARRRQHRSPRAGGHRQPHVPGDRSPHLQRLHEGLHLPEDGAGRHPADRDQRPHRSTRPALGLRDLRAAHALEPAQHHAPLPAALQRQEGAGGGSRPGRLHARALPAERRLRGRRYRRPQARAATGSTDRLAARATAAGA